LSEVANISGDEFEYWKAYYAIFPMFSIPELLAKLLAATCEDNKWLEYRCLYAQWNNPDNIPAEEDDEPDMPKLAKMIMSLKLLRSIFKATFSKPKKPTSQLPPENTQAQS